VFSSYLVLVVGGSNEKIINQQNKVIAYFEE
jgi:hypothetical protein